MTAQGEAEDQAREYATRWVPQHPVALCNNFTPNAAPAEFWCRRCGWNRVIHTDEITRAAISAELAQWRAELAAAVAGDQPKTEA